MEKICGIYKITNNLNHKSYIGQSVDIYKRWEKEKSHSAEAYTLQYALRHYGTNNFTFEIIEQCMPNQLNEREKYWIQYYDTFNTGYNETLGGDGKLLYNYEQIYYDWKNGYTCKELEEKYNCQDDVITRALRIYNISENETRRRNNEGIVIPIVMIDIVTSKRLKWFRSRLEVVDFLNLTVAQTVSIQKAISNKTKAFGYYWEKAKEEDKNLPNYSKEEILSYQQLDTCINNTHKEHLSISQRKVERPTREELKVLIRNVPFLQIGQKYQVSDNAVRKWCDYYNLPRKKSDIRKYTDEEWEKI